MTTGSHSEVHLSNDQLAAIEQLKRFYSVEMLEQLVLFQSYHVERLQASLRAMEPRPLPAVNHVREG